MTTPVPHAMGSPVTLLGGRLSEFRNWRDSLATAIADFQHWVEKHHLGTGEEDLRIYDLVEQLRAERIQVALVAEFSRGKTELINALFFSDQGQRLLPSDAGRTTMCPTELLHDDSYPPSLRLLPIETRSSQMPVSEYRRTPIHWTSIALGLDHPAQMAEAFSELGRVKPMFLHEARALGLAPPEATDPDTIIHVPVWRHAIINLPHPLLKQGLSILDTPGLNALGAEPELTLAMLPRAHAILYLLAADTGVTQSDLEVWNRHVRPARGGTTLGCLAILNKIDSLWDELRPEEAVNATIARQVSETATTLGLTRDSIIPASARKGLVARIRNDDALLARSGLPDIERRLMDDFIVGRETLLRDRVETDLGLAMAGPRQILLGRQAGLNTEIEELRTLAGRSTAVIRQMAGRLAGEKAVFERHFEQYEATRRVLMNQLRHMLDHMSLSAFDSITTRARTAMQDAWTTQGLKSAMASFFRDTSMALDKAEKQARQLRSLVDAIYRKFHADHGLPQAQAPDFPVARYREEFDRLQREADAFRDSTMLVMTEQHFVVQRFFVTLVSRARGLFEECQHAAHNWSRACLDPLNAITREHRATIERRSENLRQLQGGQDDVGRRMQLLTSALHNVAQALAELDILKNRIGVDGSGSNVPTGKE